MNEEDVVKHPTIVLQLTRATVHARAALELALAADRSFEGSARSALSALQSAIEQFYMLREQNR